MIIAGISWVPRVNGLHPTARTGSTNEMLSFTAHTSSPNLVIKR